MTGVAGVGLYAPRTRIEAEEIHEAWGQFQASGVAETAVPGADEDALTMGAAAAERALDAAGVDAAEVELLAFATTTPPVEATDLTPRLGAFLGVDGAAHRTLGGSTRAGTEALLAAADAERLPALVVAADCPRGELNSAEEHAAGAGSAAFVLAADGPARLTDRGEYAADYPGTRFRATDDDRDRGLGITAYDRQAFRECVAGAVADLDGAGEDGATDADALAMQAPDGKLPGRAARALDVDADLVTVAGDLGDLGAASALYATGRAWADGYATVTCVGYGSGAGADALAFEDTPPVAATDDAGEYVDYAHYLRLRGEITSDPPAGGGAQVSVPSWRRSRGARYRLEAGRCANCGALAFPAEGACPDCHELAGFETVTLPRAGTVETVTTISPGGAPPEFAVQAEQGGDFPVAIVAFDVDGETASLPMQVTDAGEGAVEHGDAVEAVVRRVYTQEGVTRYGAKARPTE